jgi:hypothetical protein
MARKDTQKSEAHQTTDDASTSPASNPRPGPPHPGTTPPSRGYERDAIDRDLNLSPGRPAPDEEVEGMIGEGPGAGDASSGGGAGAGIPGGGTDMRMGDQIPQGNIKEDKARLFPETQPGRDDSEFGGPVRIETDEQGKLKE